MWVRFLGPSKGRGSKKCHLLMSLPIAKELSVISKRKLFLLSRLRHRSLDEELRQFTLFCLRVKNRLVRSLKPFGTKIWINYTSLKALHDFDLESLQRHIPSYLTDEDQKTLVRELEAISSGGSAEYVLSRRNDSFNENTLQGDGWRGFKLFDYDSGERRSVRGIVLSNSCDIDPNNTRDFPARILFAPLVKLSRYKSLLEESDIHSEKVMQKIESIKAQKTTNMFYLPSGGALEEDHIVRFDEAQSMPLTAHKMSAEREKLFTLNNTGFYMLVFKLSVHFCRLQERINRKPIPA